MAALSSNQNSSDISKDNTQSANNTKPEVETSNAVNSVDNPVNQEVISSNKIEQTVEDSKNNINDKAQKDDKNEKQEIKNLDDKVIKEVELDKSIFGINVKDEIIHRMIRYQLAKKRSGNHKTKGISEISGTTRESPLNKKELVVQGRVVGVHPKMRGGGRNLWSFG